MVDPWISAFQKVKFGPARRRQRDAWLRGIVKEMEGRLKKWGYRRRAWKHRIHLCRIDHEKGERLLAQPALKSTDPQKPDWSRLDQGPVPELIQELAFPKSQNGDAAYYVAAVAAIADAALNTTDPEELFFLGRGLELYQQILVFPQLKDRLYTAEKRRGAQATNESYKREVQPLWDSIRAEARKRWERQPGLKILGLAQQLRQDFLPQMEKQHAGRRRVTPFSVEAIRKRIADLSPKRPKH
jgi:hypothetical protein